MAEKTKRGLVPIKSGINEIEGRPISPERGGLASNRVWARTIATVPREAMINLARRRIVTRRRFTRGTVPPRPEDEINLSPPVPRRSNNEMNFDGAQEE